MNIDIALLISFALTVIFFLLTPGPVSLGVVNISSQHGYRKGFRFIFGTNLASLILIGIAALGIYGVISFNESILDYLALCGATYIAYFGYSNLSQTIKNGQDSEVKFQKPIHKGFFKKGLTIGLSNPKDVIFFLSFFPQFLLVTHNEALSFLLLTLVWIIFDYSILSLYSVVSVKLLKPAIQYWVQVFSGGAFLLIAIFVFVRFIQG